MTTLHVVTLECPLFHPSLAIVWYWNGTELINLTEQSLNRSSLEADMLLGVYQCGLSMSDPFITATEGENIATIARVMPLGMQYYVIAWCIRDVIFILILSNKSIANRADSTSVCPLKVAVIER